jgi:signal peptidase
MAVVRRVLGVLGTLVSVLLVAIIAAVVVLAIAQKRSPDGIPLVAGHEVLTVLSGSMTPVIDTGDVVVDRPLTAAQANHLHVGQIVTYELPGRYFNGQPMLITHRIVGVFTIRNKATGQVEHLYVTKGDANNVVDPRSVAPGQIVGLYEWRIPYGGYVSAFIHRPLGFALFIGLPIVYLVGGEFLVLWRRLDEEERREREAAAQAAAASVTVGAGGAPGGGDSAGPAA